MSALLSSCLPKLKWTSAIVFVLLTSLASTMYACGNAGAVCKPNGYCCSGTTCEAGICEKNLPPCSQAQCACVCEVYGVENNGTNCATTDGSSYGCGDYCNNMWDYTTPCPNINN